MRREFPLPDLVWEPTAEFWAGAARGELRIPRCDSCGRLRWYPEPAVPALRRRAAHLGDDERRGHPLLLGRRDARLPSPVRRPRPRSCPRSSRSTRTPRCASRRAWSTASPARSTSRCRCEVVFRPIYVHRGRRRGDRTAVRRRRMTAHHDRRSGTGPRSSPSRPAGTSATWVA